MKDRGITRLNARLCAGLGLAFGISCLSLLTPSTQVAASDDRTLTIYSIHTKETVTATFKRNGQFVPEALGRLNHVMRDWRRDEETKMDPELIDLIWSIHRDLGSQKPVHLISGYRSPATNSKLRRTRGGQAKNSQHIQGKAADLHFPDVPVKALRNSALVREKGGVGFYPTSGIPFVHVDTARVRSWPRVPRQELALLFPSGKSKHLPASGGALTPADSRKAIAEFRSKSRDEQLATAKVLPNVVLASLDLPTRSPSPFVQLAESRGERQLASLGGGDLPWFAKSGLMNDAAQARLQLAANNPSQPIPSADRDLLTQKIFAASVEEAPEFDEEHSDSLSYNPIAIAPLLGSTSVSFDLEVAALEHPEQDATGYLFEDLAQPVALALRKGRAYTAPEALHAFSGAAVRSVFADRGQATKQAAAATPFALASAR